MTRNHFKPYVSNLWFEPKGLRDVRWCPKCRQALKLSQFDDHDIYCKVCAKRVGRLR